MYKNDLIGNLSQWLAVISLVNSCTQTQNTCLHMEIKEVQASNIVNHHIASLSLTPSALLFTMLFTLLLI